MKTKLGIGILLLATLTTFAQNNNLTTLLQQGLFEEQANRNLDAAITDYQSLATQFDKDRKIAATAIFRLGECYRAQSKTNEAAAQYQRIVQDFSDQTTLVTLSRQNLASIGMTNTKGTGTESSEAQLWNKLKNLPRPEVDKMLPTLVSDPVLDKLLQNRNEMSVKLAQLKVDYASDSLTVKRQQDALDVVSQQIDEKVNGILRALKLRADLSRNEGNTTIKDLPEPAVHSTRDEDQEIQRIQRMIKDSPDLINAPEPRSALGTPLIKAAFYGWLKVAAFLLDHGANVNGEAADLVQTSELRSAGKVTPLLAAVIAGNKTMTQFLIQHGADVNFQDEQGDTPLHLAVEKGFQAVTEVLLVSNADVNIQNRLGATPLFSAVANGQLNLVKMLLKAGAKVNVENNRGITPLSYAAGGDSSEIVKMLLAAKADPSGGKLDQPLSGAIYKKNITVAKLLLQAGANPNAVGKSDWPGVGKDSITPMWLAVNTDQLSMVQLLLKFKADPNDSKMYGRSVLFDALSDTNILEALLDARAKVDEPDNIVNQRATPLEYAARWNALDAMKSLLRYGADPNYSDYNGNTPLHYATFNNAPDRKVFDLLLAHNANPNVRDHKGKTPLDLIKEKQQSSQRGFIPSPGRGSIEQADLARKVADLLRQHGALDNLPDWNSIKISFPFANFSDIVFRKGTNDWNHFTLLELICHEGGNFSFADFGHIVILRPNTNNMTSKRITVNLLNATNSVDCTKDLPLEFGDTVEFAEREHTLAQKDHWTPEQLPKIVSYLKEHAGTAKLIVAGGQTIEVPLKKFTPRNCNLRDVLGSSLAQNVLTSNSDLSRVKVVRKDPQTGKRQEWILNCINLNNAPDFWLRNGDVVAVPEKP